MTTLTTPSNGVTVSRYADYTVYTKDDGYNYLNILINLEAIKKSADIFSIWNPKHQVFKFDYEGRAYVAKIDPEKPKYFENKLWQILTGPFYSTQMKAVNRAINNGCTVVPDIYLVAEKKDMFLCSENIIIMEYAPGKSLCHFPDANTFRTVILDALQELHSYGLVMGDVNCGNFIINDNRCKILDLSWHGMALLGQAKDRTLMQRVYGWKIPSRTLPEKLAEAYIRLKRGIQTSLSQFKQKIKNR